MRLIVSERKKRILIAFFRGLFLIYFNNSFQTCLGIKKIRNVKNTFVADGKRIYTLHFSLGCMKLKYDTSLYIRH